MRLLSKGNLKKLTPGKLLKRLWAKYRAKKVRSRGVPVVFVDRYGLKVGLKPTDSVFEYYYYGGLPEIKEQNLVKNMVRPGMTAFDVGANIGLYTLLLAKLVGNTGRVFSFEPVETGRLRENVKLNGLANVTVDSRLVMAEPGRQQIHIYTGGLNGLHTVANRHLKDAEIRTEEKEAVSLDYYCRQGQLTKIDFLKIDVEGAEGQVLAGAANLLRRQAIDMILFEVSINTYRDMNTTIAEIFQLLRSCGYEIYEITGGRLSPAKREDYISDNLIALSVAAQRRLISVLI